MTTRKVVVVFEIEDRVSADEFHEELCLIFHEQQEVKTVVHNISIDMPPMHLHIWPVDMEVESPEPDEDIDLEWEDTYDDHEQYIGTLTDGRHLELRLITERASGQPQPTKRPTYKCPGCEVKLDLVQVDEVHGTIGDEPVTSYSHHFECATCPELLGVVIDLPWDLNENQEDKS